MANDEDDGDAVRVYRDTTPGYEEARSLRYIRRGDGNVWVVTLTTITGIENYKIRDYEPYR